MAPPADDVRLAKQADTLYGLYERKAKAFRTALISVMSLITIVLALIFYPYVAFRGERYALEAEQEANAKVLARAVQNAEEADSLMKEYREAMPADYQRISDLELNALRAQAPAHARALAEIRTAVGGDPEAESWLAEAKAGEEPPQALLRRHSELREGRHKPCFWLAGTPWLRCTLKETLTAFDSSVVELFERSRVSEMRRRLFGSLAEGLAALRDSFGVYLVSDAEVWRLDAAAIATGMSDRHPEYLGINSDDWSKQLEIGGTLAQQINHYVGLYLQMLEAHERYVFEMVDRLHAEADDLKREQRRIEEALEIVAAKLEGLKGLQDIETPFGTLPVGINELVLLFPVLVAAGFLLMASLFVESLELRQEYRQLTRMTDPDGETLPDRRVALMAPLWIDPLTPLSQRAYRGAILALPVLAFLASVWLLHENRLLTDPFLREARLNGTIYFILYAISALVILVGLRRVVYALWGQSVHGQTEAAPENKDPDDDSPQART